MLFFPPGKSYVYLQNFEKALLEILMCSSTFCLLENLTCSYKELCLLLENLRCSYYIPSLLETLMCSRNLLKNRSWKKRTDIIAKQLSYHVPTHVLFILTKIMWADTMVFWKRNFGIHNGHWIMFLFIFCNTETTFTI